METRTMETLRAWIVIVGCNSVLDAVKLAMANRTSSAISMMRTTVRTQYRLINWAFWFLSGNDKKNEVGILAVQATLMHIGINGDGGEMNVVDSFTN
jgi:hypothetical protein